MRIKVVLVEWVDACEFDAEHTQEQALNAKPIPRLRPGLLVEETKNFVTIAWDIDARNVWDKLISIPRAWLKNGKVEVLKTVEW